MSHVLYGVIEGQVMQELVIYSFHSIKGANKLMVGAALVLDDMLS